MILADTTVWVDLFRGRDSPEKRRLEETLSRGEIVAITDVILTEILRGIPSDAEFRLVRRRLSVFPRLPARAPETFVHAAQLYRRCRAKGATARSTVDCLIAAVCIEHGAALLHHDSDFDLLAKCTRLKTVPRMDS